MRRSTANLSLALIVRLCLQHDAVARVHLQQLVVVLMLLSGPDGPSIPLIVGVVVGVTAAVLVIIAVVVFIRVIRPRLRKRSDNPSLPVSVNRRLP